MSFLDFRYNHDFTDTENQPNTDIYRVTEMSVLPVFLESIQPNQNIDFRYNRHKSKPKQYFGSDRLSMFVLVKTFCFLQTSTKIKKTVSFVPVFKDLKKYTVLFGRKVRKMFSGTTKTQIIPFFGLIDILVWCYGFNQYQNTCEKYKGIGISDRYKPIYFIESV